MTEKVKITWNGKEIEAVKGSNLLQAALDNGQEVAHYCYHAGLSIAGACRMCMVEQDGVPSARSQHVMQLVVMEWLSVTILQKLKLLSEATLQFHLLNHPLDLSSL